MSSDVLVIGGGIVGAAVALHSASRGATVTVVDAGFRDQGATRASFAWINANNKTPREYFDLNLAGMREYAQLGDEFGDLLSSRGAGNTEWAASDDGIQRLEEKVERLRSWGYAAESLPIAELSRIEPAMRAPEGVSQFAWFPEEGYVEPVELTERMLEQAIERGATIESGVTVETLHIDSGRVTGVMTSTGEVLHADLVVVSSGSASDQVLASGGLRLPMSPTVGMVALSEPGPVSLRSVHHDEGMHIRPGADGRVMMRHTDFDAQVRLDQPVPGEVLEKLRDRVAAVLPPVAGRGIEWARVAVRPIPGDGHPAVGFWPDVENLYVVVTHSGVTLGPLLGRLAATELLDNQRFSELEAFRPDRFAH